MKTKSKLMGMMMMAAALAMVPAVQAQTNIWSYTGLGAAPATDDKLFLYDTSATASKTITIANLFTSPAFTTPTLGVATATSVNGLTITSSTGTLTITNAKTLSVSNTLTFTGTDSSTVAFGAGGTVVYTTATQTLTNKTLTSPTMTAPVLGVATATSLNGLTITTSTGTLTVTNGKTLVVSNTLTFTGTDSSTVAFGAGGTVTYATDALSVFASTSSAQLAGVLSNETGSGLAVFGTSPTLTTPVLTTPTFTVLTENVTATNVITAGESGSTFFLNSSTEFVSTLPAPAAGLRFTFVVVAAPSGASYTVVTNSSANIIKGAQNSVAGDAGDFGTADDTVSFVDGQAVAGDRIVCESDGTYWYVYAISKVAAGVTFTQAN